MFQLVNIHVHLSVPFDSIYDCLHSDGFVVANYCVFGLIMPQNNISVYLMSSEHSW